MSAGIREPVSVGGQAFTFTLCRKAENLGPVQIDHWWMRTTELYRQRAQRQCNGGNYEAVTETFWAQCLIDNSHVERDVQESYLLARLVPHVRSQGSRRVVGDAYLAPNTKDARQNRKTALQKLDRLLQGSRTETMTRLEFSRRTGDVIGPPVLADELKEAYLACCKELFDPVVAVLATDKEAAVARLLASWQRLMRSVGRRGGQQTKKQVLDILSYEARAALHRCYSDAWDKLLLPHLTKAYQLSTETISFLRLWHLDHTSESNLGNVADFHLFHGHIFALHPATALFLSTPVGRELVGCWLATGVDNEDFGRLLHGIFVAVVDYAGLRDEASQRRRKQPLGFGGPELVDLEELLDRRREKRSRDVRKRDR